MNTLLNTTLDSKIKKINYCGAVLANKPEGISSTTLVSLLRRRLDFKTIGHTGILDRAASGLMLLLVGRSTSLAQFFLHADKEYISTIKLGISTDTHDREGEIIDSIDEIKVRTFMSEHKERIVNTILSWPLLEEQVPPIYSALKHRGKRLSDLAREGKQVEVRPRKIKIYECDILNYDIENCIIELRLKVTGGTYVRSLARDLGLSLGIPSYLYSLKRIGLASLKLNENVWEFSEEKKELQIILNHKGGYGDEETIGNEKGKNTKEVIHILGPREILPHWPCVKLKKKEYEAKLLKGVGLPPVALEGNLPNKVFQNFFIENQEGQVLAWARRTVGGYKYGRILY